MSFLNNTGLARLWEHIIALVDIKTEVAKSYTDTEIANLQESLGDLSGLSGIPIGAGTGENSIILNDDNNNASGDYSHAEGGETIAMGTNSHAEGGWTIAMGNNSHAEGYASGRLPDNITTSSTNDEILEARNNVPFSLAKGQGSHVEGLNTVALGTGSHAEGWDSIAIKDSAHAEGRYTTASGENSHTEGYSTVALGWGSHTEGISYSKAPSDITVNSSNEEIIEAWSNNGFTLAKGQGSHAEGQHTLALGYSSHAEGNGAISAGEASHAEGNCTVAGGRGAHAEGVSEGTIPSNITFYTPKEEIIEAWNDNPFTLAKGQGSHAEGYNTLALKDGSHAEGLATIASGDYSHAEGQFTAAPGENSHAEGEGTTASGSSSHAEGYSTVTFGYGAHAEGWETKAYGDASHTEGYNTTASNYDAHAEGYETIAAGEDSHAEGWGTVAYSNQLHVQGRYNKIEEYPAFTEGIYENESIDNVLYDTDNYCYQVFNSYTFDAINGIYIANDPVIINIEDNTNYEEILNILNDYNYLGVGTENVVYIILEKVENYCLEENNIISINNAILHMILEESGSFNGKYAHIVGNGYYDYETDEEVRSNAHTLDWDGNAWFAGDVFVGGTSQDDGKKLLTEEALSDLGAITIDLEGATEGTSMGIDADTFCGYTLDSFVMYNVGDSDNGEAEPVLDADTLGGQLPDYFATAEAVQTAQATADNAMPKVINVITSGTDLNEYFEDGLYYFSSNSTPLNIPTGVNGWLMVLTGADSDVFHCKQLWWRMGTPDSNDHNCYVRTYGGSKAWSAWTMLMTAKGGTFTGNVVANSTNRSGDFVRNICVKNSSNSNVSTNTVYFTRK